MSFAYTLPTGDGPTRKHVQYFEMLGHRAIWADGWKAVATHWSTRMLQFVPETAHDLHDGDFAADLWELYNLDEDFSECDDRAQHEPEKVAELVELWWGEARRNQVLPLSEQLSPANAQRASSNRGPSTCTTDGSSWRRRRALTCMIVPTRSRRCSTSTRGG